MLPHEYFTDNEIRCKCGCGLMPALPDLEKLYALRIMCGFPLPILSGARCTAHNRRVGGAAGSTHMPAAARVGVSNTWGGQGWDISPLPMNRQIVVIKNALKCGFRGFGFRDNMLHIDNAKRPELTRWNY